MTKKGWIALGAACAVVVGITVVNAVASAPKQVKDEAVTLYLDGKETPGLYTGVMQGGKPNGEGRFVCTQTFTDTSYTEEGERIREAEDVEGMAYIGTWEDGLLQGPAKGYWSNGSLYTEATFVDGLRQGEGTEYADQTGNVMYKGAFVDGSREGQGTCYYSNGGYTVGTFVGGALCGPGKEYDGEGNLCYEGDYADDYWEGQGVYYHPGGNRYEGAFVKNNACGQGILYDKKGEKIYEGEWANNAFNGEGRWYGQSGKVAYEGHFVDGKEDGYGVQYYTDGAVYRKGQWKAGKYIGK